MESTGIQSDMLASILRALEDDRLDPDRASATGAGSLPSAFLVTDLAVACFNAVGLSVSSLLELLFGLKPNVKTDRLLASAWYHSTIRPIDWKLDSPWDPLSGNYRTADGWIRLHTNLASHRTAAMSVLGTKPNRQDVANEVSGWHSEELELAIIASGGCAAKMRTISEWSSHAHGSWLADQPLILRDRSGQRNNLSHWQPSTSLPLQGLRVLDLTRVLAGPVCTRMLAGFGAEVLRIDPPGWDEAGVLQEVNLGKRRSTLDLSSPNDLLRFEELLSSADLLVSGLRPGALPSLGLDSETIATLNPGLIWISLSAYGPSGPWSERRGFDSLVQMSTGIADYQMRIANSPDPVPLPVQALDHATGYLMAAESICALNDLLETGLARRSRLSLAKTAELLLRYRMAQFKGDLNPQDADVSPQIEKTSWGDARRLLPPVQVEGVNLGWNIPSGKSGEHSASWS